MTAALAGEVRSQVFLREVSDGTLAQRIRDLMDRCRWSDWVKPGARVLVKPNLCTAVPEKCAMSNTDPRIARAVCEVLLTRTPHVFVVESDGLRQTAWEAFQASGYANFPRELGITLLNLTESEWVRLEVVPVRSVGLPRVMLECDAFITLPVLKTHALTYFTGAIKNQWGCVPQYDRILLHRYLDEMLVSLHAIFRPAMALMDGIIAMEGRGPANGRPRRLNVVLASQDSVALDATAMRLVGLDPARCRHVSMAAENKLGNVSSDRICVDGDWNRHACRFEPAVLDSAIAAMDYLSRYRWFVKYLLEKDFVFYPIRAGVKVLRKVGIVEGGG